MGRSIEDQRMQGIILVALIAIANLLMRSAPASAQTEMRCTGASLVLSRNFKEIKTGDPVTITGYLDGRLVKFALHKSSQFRLGGSRRAEPEIDFSAKSFFIGGDYFTDCWVK